jgi:phospholipid/cholesterol/gamma-HCH transport system ATP-binding protein
VLGKSGTGKSVLIKCIVRLLNQDSGTITVLGEDVGALDIRKLGELRRKIGFLFQGGALYDSMTVRQNLAFVLQRTGGRLTRRQITDKTVEALEHVGLPNALDKMPSELSGGMRKRISLARTIVVDPEILLYDEPTTGLDPVTSSEISLLINEIQEKFRTSSIIITHDIACARATADRLVMLREGLVHAEGSLEEFAASTDTLVRSFMQ